MDTRPKILVVEDREPIRETWRDLLEENGEFATDGAINLAEAIAATDRRRYDVALVDVKLNEDDPSNRDGIEFVEHLRWLDEGTQSIVFTDIVDEPMLPRNVLLQHGAVDFMNKQHLATAGNAVLVERIRNAVKKARESQAAATDKATKVVTGAVSDERLLQLRFKGGADTLIKAFRAACAYLAPLLPEKGAQPALRTVDGRQVFSGRFWSKGQGTAVEILAFGSDTPPESLHSGDAAQRKPLYNRLKAGLSIMVLECPELDRAGFYTPR